MRMSSFFRQARRLFSATLAFALQSLLVLAAAGAAELPLSHALRWLARYAHVGSVHRVMAASLERSMLLATLVWMLAELCLAVHALRALRHGRSEMSWGALFTPLLMVLYVAGGALVMAAMAAFVSNTARVFLSESAATWAGYAAAALMAFWLLQIGWAELPRRPAWGRR